MALRNIIGSYVSVKMMYVMILNSVCEGLQDFGNVQKCTAFESSLCKVPFIFSLTIGNIHWVLEME